MSKKYLVRFFGGVVVEAESADDAKEQFNIAIEEAGIRNCGGIEDEIIASAEIKEVEKWYEED